MVITTEIRPCLQLQPFVRSFTYRELSPLCGKISRPLFATQDFMLTFNLTEKKFGFTAPGDDGLLQTEQTMNSRIIITGIGSRFAGIMSSDGDARLFTIYFTPTGFYHLFGIPAVHFTNMLEEDIDSCNRCLALLRQQLMATPSHTDMVKCSEKFLLQQLAKSKSKDPYGAMFAISRYLLQNPDASSIESMAYNANMSMKTLERKFIEQVGATPKLYTKIGRFNKAIVQKMNDFSKSWIDIAHTCGYYDQMHLIKDFRLFSGTSPTSFFKSTPPVIEHLTNSEKDVSYH